MDSTEPSAEAYVKEIEAVYPEIAPLASSVFVYNYYNAMEGVAAGASRTSTEASPGGQKSLQNA